MSQVRSHPNDYSHQSPPAIIIHVLKENKRPIGFAPWPKEKKRKAPKTSPSNTV